MRVINAGKTLTTIGGIASVALTPLLVPAIPSAMRAVTAEAALLTDTALIMGGSMNPTPAPSYVTDLNEHYIQPNPEFTGYEPNGLFTPEQLWPVFGDMTFDPSVAEGVDDLDAAIRQHLDAGDNVLVTGLSQSSTISTLEMRNLMADPPENADDLRFILIGDPNNPNGGLFERFDGVHWPFVNMTMSGSTPTDAFPTDIYSGEYDGFADFPRYPLNILSVINALMGIMTVHTAYPDFTADEVTSAVHIGHSDLTDFYMIPTEQLPILAPLYRLGDFGKVIADAIGPDLRVFIDLGYGNPDNGWSLDPGESAPIGFLPKLDPLAVLSALQLGAVQGTVDPINDVLGYAGLDPLPDWVTELLKFTSGYDITHALDQAMTSALTELSEQTGLESLDPDVLFDGSPLIDGTPVLDAMQGVLSLF